jgi:hypothetical protein
MISLLVSLMISLFIVRVMISQLVVQVMIYQLVMSVMILHLVMQVMIPLLRVESGRRKWFSLKDKNMRKRAKGSNPQILLEMFLFWNP